MHKATKERDFDKVELNVNSFAKSSKYNDNNKRKFSI